MSSNNNTQFLVVKFLGSILIGELIFLGYLLLSPGRNSFLDAQQVAQLNSKMQTTDWKSCNISNLKFSISYPRIYKKYSEDFDNNFIANANYVNYLLNVKKVPITLGDNDNLITLIEYCNKNIKTQKNTVSDENLKIIKEQQSKLINNNY